MEIYSKEGKNVFKCPIPNNSLKKIFWGCFTTKRPANRNNHLRVILEELFKDETIEQVYDRRKIGLCIASLKLVDYSPRVFKTPHNPKKHADNKRNLADVCLATSAAPIIFPVVAIPEPDNANVKEHFVDGGLWANNPTLIGLVEALEISGPNQPIEIISIGTCPASSGETLKEENVEKGIIDWNWGINILEASGNAQAKSVEFICNFLEKRLSDLGKKVSIYRLPQRCLSSAQEKAIGLDKATKEACNTLISLGIEDGKEIYSMALCKNTKFSVLNDIFAELNDLPEGGNNG